MPFARALVAFLVLPGMVAFLAPPLIAQADPWREPESTWLPGLAPLLLGLAILLWCVRDFYVLGKGTLAPWDPPKQLVVVGLYRFVRNPMYVGVLLLVIGWACLLRSPLVGVYSVAVFVLFYLRVLTYEEPALE